MITVAIGDLVASTILTFCENLAELGCPKDCKEPDMWYRYLSPEEQRKVAEKMLEIEERDSKRFEKDKEYIKKESKKVTKEVKKFIKTIEKAHKNAGKSKLRFP